MKTLLRSRLTRWLSLLAMGGVALFIWWWLFGNHYPVTSTPMVFAARFEGHLIYWLDNERFLVPGWERPADVPEGQEAGKKFPPVGLYIWNTRTHSATRHSDLGAHYSFCYSDGFIVYTVFDDGKTRRSRQGQFGHEEELPLGVRPSVDATSQDFQACPLRDPVTFARPEHLNKSLRLNPLKPEHGYLTDEVPRNGPSLKDVIPHQNEHLKLFRPEIEQPVVTPILTREVAGGPIGLFYSDYAKRYVIIPYNYRSFDLANINRRSWPSSQPLIVYLLAPDGSVETVTVPYGHWVRPNIALPTPEGLFIASTSAPGGNSKQAGGWLVRDGRMKKIFDHLPMAAGVSPDGCKIAYAANDFNPKTTDYVKIIHLCSEAAP